MIEISLPCIAQRRRRRALSICIYLSIVAFIYHIMMMLYLAHDLPDPISNLSPQLPIKNKQQQQQQSSLLSYEHHSISRKLTDQQIIEHPSTHTHENTSEENNENTSEENIRIEDIITDGETIAAILQGDINFSEYLANSSTTPTTTPTKATTPRLRFIPGQINTNLTKANILHYCYSNPEIYARHFPESDRQVSTISDKYKLVYLHLPKAGSSTSRYLLEHSLDGHNAPLNAAGNDLDTRYVNYTVFTFVREPLQRFYSQYDEAFVRTSPWNKMQNPFYDTNKDKHPFPYLFDGMTKYHDYEDAFCPPNKRKIRKDCIYAPSQENGTLAARLDRFVQDYDGRSPFDVHLALQVPMLSNIVDGRSLFITELHNTTNSERDWNNIAKKYIGEEAILKNAEKNKKKGVSASGGVIQGRSYPRRFNKTIVGIETEKRICQLTLLDYCCLNFPLPAVCNDGEVDSKALTCMMDYDAVNDRIRIQPSVFPDKAK